MPGARTHPFARDDQDLIENSTPLNANLARSFSLLSFFFNFFQSCPQRLFRGLAVRAEKPYTGEMPRKRAVFRPRTVAKPRKSCKRRACRTSALTAMKYPPLISPSLPPALMVQATCSNAGKSLLAAAFCRLLARRGLRVAPFKAQNMALNSFVTREGGEMGRAQALQALACGRAPDVRMNPVLLKPTSRDGSHVIVLGQPLTSMKAREYFRSRRMLWPKVRQAYAELASRNDVMVLEGAGSPAEINLRAHDIVNMHMAHAAGARVLLAADIDRGGAFAALTGTLHLLSRKDRALVAGFLLNKFRGDASLLEPALQTVSRKTRTPFLGVIPMLEGLRLPEEDSVAFKEGTLPDLDTGMPDDAALTADPSLLDVALVDLPHISNATDLDALRCESHVRVRLVRRPEELGRPHLCLIPGSRNTLADMRFLRDSGLEDALAAYAGNARAASGTGGFAGMLLGICGGLQMLGTTLEDPLHLENGGSLPGMHLLPLQTALAAEKTLRQSHALAMPPLTERPCELSGYEIHHGVTRQCETPFSSDGFSTRPIAVLQDGTPVGWGLCKGESLPPVWGTYLHGLFDGDAFRHGLLRRLRRAAGRAQAAGERAYALGPELDRLADTVEAHCDWPRILAMLGL